MTLSTLFTNAKRATSHGIAKFSNKIIEWKATCPKPPLHVRSWSLTNKQIEQLKHRNLHQDLHKTATSLIDRMNCRAIRLFVKISEHGKQRLHMLYMQDKSSKMKILIYTYWKLAKPRQFKQLQNTTSQTLIDGANIWMATWLYNIVLSENLASWILDPRSSKLETRSLRLETRSWHLETRSIRASRHEDRVSSFKLPVSTYFWMVLYILEV